MNREDLEDHRGLVEILVLLQILEDHRVPEDLFNLYTLLNLLVLVFQEDLEDLEDPEALGIQVVQFLLQALCALYDLYVHDIQ